MWFLHSGHMGRAVSCCMCVIHSQLTAGPGKASRSHQSTELQLLQRGNETTTSNIRIHTPLYVACTYTQHVTHRPLQGTHASTATSSAHTAEGNTYSPLHVTHTHTKAGLYTQFYCTVRCGLGLKDPVSTADWSIAVISIMTSSPRC